MHIFIIESAISMTHKRNLTIDLLKVFACLLVIACHSNIFSDITPSQVTWRVFFGDGVTYFFILAGFFLYKKSFSKTLLHSLSHIALPAFFFTLFAWIFSDWIFHQSSFLFCLKNSFSVVIPMCKSLIHLSPGADLANHLWFVFSYLFLILLIPLTRQICFHPKLRRLALVVGFLLILCHEFSLFYRNMSFQKYDLILTYYAYPVYFALCGYAIYQYLPQIKNNFRLRLLCPLLGIGLETIRCILQYRALCLNPTNNFYMGWNTSFSLIITICVILFVLSFDLSDGWLAKVALLGPYTFGIYLLHIPVLCFLQHHSILPIFNSWFPLAAQMSFIQQFLYISIVTLVIFGISLAFTFFIIKTKTVIKKSIDKCYFFKK